MKRISGALELRSWGYSVQLVDPGPLPHPQASSTDISKVVRREYGADEFCMGQMEKALAGWIADAVDGSQNGALERFALREPGERLTEDARNTSE
jgi:hypothetical protein